MLRNYIISYTNSYIAFVVTAQCAPLVFTVVLNIRSHTDISRLKVSARACNTAASVIAVVRVHLNVIIEMTHWFYTRVSLRSISHLCRSRSEYRTQPPGAFRLADNNVKQDTKQSTQQHRIVPLGIFFRSKQ